MYKKICLERKTARIADLHSVSRSLIEATVEIPACAHTWLFIGPVPTTYFITYFQCNAHFPVLNLRSVKREAKAWNLVCNIAAERVELISDVGSFTTHGSNLSYNTQVVAGSENLLQKVESSFAFCNKICSCCALYWSKANLFCNWWRNSCVWRHFCVILFSQKQWAPVRSQYSRNLNCNTLIKLQDRF